MITNHRCSLARYRLLLTSTGKSLRLAFTLIELLVVLFILILLTAIALPTFKNLLADQKVSLSAQSIAAFFDEARSRAIAEGQYVGVRIERLQNLNTIDFGSSASIRVRQLVGAPPYSGEASNAAVTVAVNGNGTATLSFSNQDNQLLTLFDAAMPSNTPNAPIRDGDLIELPGGRTFPLKFTGNNGTIVTALIDLNGPEDGAVGGTATETFPRGHHRPPSGRLKYRIHRAPTVSSTQVLSLDRGIAIDLNYSGIGLRGNQFAPAARGATQMNQPVDIVFGPDGHVEYASSDSRGNPQPPAGMIYLCVGSTDGVRDAANLFSREVGAVANLMSLDSIWVVINPNTGRVTTSPLASVAGFPVTMSDALLQAREFASRSHTLDAAS